jgi:hypothetical protein
MASNNTIVLEGEIGTKYEEYIASGVGKPGHLVMLDSNGKVLKHNVYGGRAARMFATEMALLGKTITDAWAIGDTVPVHRAVPNVDEINARLPAGAAAVVKGDTLISNGDGCLVKATAAGSVVYANTAASAAVTNTTAETAFDKSYTFPANSLKAGDVIKIRFQGIATATNSTDTLAIKLYIGGITGTALISMAATDVADNNVFQGEYTLIVRTVGASGTIVGVGTFKSIPAAEGTMTIKDDILASTTIDTTATQQVAVSATWSVQSTSNSVRLDVLTVEQVRSSGPPGGEVLAIATEAVDNSAGTDEAFLSVMVV